MSTPQRTYVALVRAINVGGHGVITMTALRSLFESVGLTNVVTHIQSGNVLFTTKAVDSKQLERQLDERLTAALGYHVGVFVLTPQELKTAADNNPFDPQRQAGQQQCHLMFLSGEPDAAHRAALMVLQGDDYRFAVRGKVVYYTYSRALAGSRRSVNFEKVLGVSGTARTWKVVDKLIELSSAR